MTITEAQQTVDTWIKTYGVRYFNELTNMACLTEEVGELARIIARKIRRTIIQSQRKTRPRRRNGRRSMGAYMPGKSNGRRP